MKVVFATPAYDSKVNLEFLESLVKTLGLLAQAGVDASFISVAGDCYVARARNTLVRQFLDDPEATHLFFLDADMGWDPAGVLKVLKRQQSIVGGAYPLKREAEDYPVSIHCNENGTPIVEDGLIAAAWLPTGFLCIQRDVFSAMISLGVAAPYKGAGAFGMESCQMYNFFECAMDEGRWYGEDTYFCLKAGRLGYKIWCEPDIDFVHVGGKSFRGNYHQFLMRQPGGSHERI